MSKQSFVCRRCRRRRRRAHASLMPFLCLPHVGDAVVYSYI